MPLNQLLTIGGLPDHRQGCARSWGYNCPNYRAAGPGKTTGFGQLAGEGPIEQVEAQVNVDVGFFQVGEWNAEIFSGSIPRVLAVAIGDGDGHLPLQGC